MHKSSFVSIRHIIQQSLQTPPYQESWSKSIIVAAWAKLLPHMESQLKELYIKQKVVYIRLASTILAHDLRKKKKELLRKLNRNIRHSGGEEHVIRDIVFL